MIARGPAAKQEEVGHRGSAIPTRSNDGRGWLLPKKVNPHRHSSAAVDLAAVVGSADAAVLRPGPPPRKRPPPRPTRTAHRTGIAWMTGSAGVAGVSPPCPLLRLQRLRRRLPRRRVRGLHDLPPHLRIDGGAGVGGIDAGPSPSAEEAREPLRVHRHRLLLLPSQWPNPSTKDRSRYRSYPTKSRSTPEAPHPPVLSWDDAPPHSPHPSKHPQPPHLHPCPW